VHGAERPFWREFPARPDAVRERAVAGLTDIARRHRGGTVVVVSHDAVNRQVLVAFD
jgi:broad specificity phosphatase PhoE